MAFSHVLGGTTFTQANFEGNAYANESTGFPKSLEKIVEHVANAYRGTSTTSTAVGTGSKTLTVTNSNSQIPAFAVGMPVRISRTSAPTTTYMQGEITAFNTSTGVTTVNVTSSLGSGTHTDWTICIGGNQVTASASPLGVADGGTGLSSFTAGDILYASGSTTIAKLAKGSASQVLKMNSGATAPEWGSSASSDLVDDTSPQLGGQLDVNGQAIGDGTLELLKFSETGSAVNEFTIANSATGNNPTFSATGDDTNIGINITPKGSGSTIISGSMNDTISTTGKALVLGF
tara:strand:+ start:586 stop:1455 length:870 start_codon:yes stop_codon:yes gene_type:complete